MVANRYGCDIVPHVVNTQPEEQGFARNAMNAISVILADGRKLHCSPGTEVGSLLQSPTSEAGLPYIAALVNNDCASLSYPLTVNADVEFLTIADAHGRRIYRRSLGFLLAKAVLDMFPDAQFSLDHAFGSGLYCSFNDPHTDNAGIGQEQLRDLEAYMHKLVSRRIPIERRKIAYADAVAEFAQSEQADKLSLLKYRNPPRIVIHWCDGFSDLAHGPLVPATGVLGVFKLIPYDPGFVLDLPDPAKPREVATFVDQPHLFSIIQEHKEWGRVLHVNTVGRLNDIISSGDVDDFMRTAEALHEKKVAHIADRIAAAGGNVRVILIAGPSSAGKTTFAKRLSTHLRVNGLEPVTVAIDDYFVGIERNPRDEHGQPDFEHIEAVDLELFNQDLLKLINGEEIELPHFNFARKCREYKGDRLRMESDQILIIEGIHGLNPRLTEMVPADRKFKIYVSALTQLSVDSNNRISTTDNRLMRRIVRDHNYRGHTALITLRQWPSVRRGENTWIFPFQMEADDTFNSALDYELAALKPFVEPLLMQVKPSHPEYAEARRLSEFLLSFLSISSRAVPRTSILREYIGGSIFRY